MSVRTRTVKVLYVDPVLVTGYVGGSHISLLELMDAMRQRGHDVLLACPYEGEVTARARKLGIPVVFFHMGRLIETRITVRGRRFFNWFAAAWNLFAYLAAAISLYRLACVTGVDVVHCNQMLLAISAGLAARLAGIPNVWHVRAIPSRSVPRFAIQLYGLLGRLLADRIITNSKATAQFLQPTLAKPRIVVIYNAVPLKSPPEAEKVAAVCRQLNIPDSARILVILGRIMPRKGHLFAVDALHQIVHVHKRSDVRLLVVGYVHTEPEYYRSLLRRIDELQLKGNVHFIGFQADVSPFYELADVILSCSIEHESFGRTLIEAMAAGKPVVATAVGAVPEIVEDGVTGFLVPPDQPELFARRVLAVLSSRELALRMGESGRSRVTRMFSMESCCSQIEHIYWELLDQHSAHPKKVDCHAD